MRWKPTIVLGLTAMAAAGCGGGGVGANHQVESTFEHIMSELRSRNPAVCSQFSGRYALENTGKSNYSDALAICRRHVRSGSVPVPSEVKIQKTKVKANSATLWVEVPGQGSGVFHMVRQSGHWKIDSVTAK
jgi:hypothetical protein